MQCKKLKLKKNNWSCESYRFDEVFSENASQKRVYEVVAKPVVEASRTCHHPFIYTCNVLLTMSNIFSLQMLMFVCFLCSYINFSW